MSRASFRAWLRNWREWGNVILLFLTLEIVIFSIEQAKWIQPQPSLTAILALAVLTGWLLVKSRLPTVATFLLMVPLGVLVTIWQASSLLLPLETASRGSQSMAALPSWWQVISAAKPSEGTIHFAIFLSFFTWLIGYVSIWSILRRQNAWVAVFLGAITILVNLSNLPEKHYTFFFFYLLAAMLLIGQTHLARYYSWLKNYTIDYPKRGLIYFMAVLLCLTLLAAAISWLLPEIRVSRLEALISTNMLWRNDIEESQINFLAAIPAKQPFFKGSKQKDMVFGPTWERGNEVLFVITSERPSYWRAWMYDTYTSSGWTSSPTSEYVHGQGVPWTEVETFSDRTELTYTVQTNLKTDVLLTAGTFVSSDTLVLMQLGGKDIVAVTTPRLLRPNERYTVTARISATTPADLSQASENYPLPVIDRYLQLPPDFPERVRQLSENITKGAKSAYEKIRAIENYLSQFPYKLDVAALPQGTDGVGHFLFTQKSGFCLHFASAMAVMLRSVGMPSRLIVGYLPGELDSRTGSYVVRNKHYHAWIEVYSPNYGWVEVEATPKASLAISRDELGLAADIIWDEWAVWEILGIPVEITVDTGNTGATFRQRLGAILFFTFAGGILLIFLILTLGAVFYYWLWRLKGPDYSSEIYAKMCFLASLVKLRPRLQQTPLEYGARLASVFPQQAKALDIIVQAYLESRFGPKRGLRLVPEGSLLTSRGNVYHVLLKRFFRMR